MYRIASHAARVRIARSILRLAAGVACIALPAGAQVNLSITEADNGGFQVAATPPNDPNPDGIALGCSLNSPQFANLNTFPSGSTNAACIQTATIWVVNKGTAATSGQVAVNAALSPVQPKGSTVLATNGYCAFPGGCSAVGSNTANGWACIVTQGNVNCNRSDSLAAGGTYPAIVIRFLREDFSPPSTWNDLVTVSGGLDGGLTETDPTDNQLVTAPLAWQIIGQSNIPQTERASANGRYVTIHSVPEGLLVAVDGSLVKTPHTDFWLSGSTHSVDGDANGVPWGTPFGQTGSSPNLPWLLNSPTPVIGSITGTKKDTGIPSVIWSTLPPDVITGTVNYEAITFLYHKP